MGLFEVSEKAVVLDDLLRLKIASFEALMFNDGDNAFDAQTVTCEFFGILGQDSGLLG